MEFDPRSLPPPNLPYLRRNHVTVQHFKMFLDFSLVSGGKCFSNQNVVVISLNSLKKQKQKHNKTS